MDFRCGHPDEWEFFFKNYGHAVDEMTKAHAICLSMLKAASPEGQEQNVIHALASACLKEFEEIAYWLATAMELERRSCSGPSTSV